MQPLPFSKRTTASVAVFACLFIASPQGAQMLSETVNTKVSLQLSYSQLINVYPQLIHQDTANNAADLQAAINTSVTILTNLKATLDAMMETGDQSFVLAHMQQVVTGGLAQGKEAQSA